ncbi:putative nuclease HARBI1 [Belonocnema kinseyi]|uniref:putative nuclease HARBI1 n=1 Tax=Belonocnema kinseyi TaxID=2817044 RepID=UPI00143D88AB|nr:putative nuclease HARBI1 [Belonocnema kinseyi]
MRVICVDIHREKEALSDILISSDDENDIFIDRRPRVIKERINYFETLDDLDFIMRFRLSKNSVEELLLEIEHDLQQATQRNHAIQHRIQLLLTLRYYATGSFLISAGDFSGVSKTSTHRIAHRVTAAIARLARRDIKLPTSAEERAVAQVDFYATARFPRVISALDCTHVKVQSFSGNDAEVFRNRKGYFSINGIILADGGYALKPYLITPIQNLQTPAEILFNESQIRTRKNIERTFGFWKRRFPCLVAGMRFSVSHVLPVIVATAVLHNKARMAAETMPPDDPLLNI